MSVPDVIVTAGVIGETVPFIITDTDGMTPTSQAAVMTVTWIAEDGRVRPLTLLSAGSALFGYTFSARDYPTARLERGQLRVSLATTTFWVTPPFIVQVVKHV